MASGRPVLLALAAVAVLGGCRPPHLVDLHTSHAPEDRRFDFTALAPETVVTLGLVAPSALQGFGIPLLHALTEAVGDRVPALRRTSYLETINALNAQGLADDYAELLAGFARNGILDGTRLRKMGTALHARYVLLPGCADFREVLLDRFEISGLKIVQTRLTTLRLWLQLWDTSDGRLLWESAGEASMASELLQRRRIVPVDEVAEKLWRRMITGRRWP